MSAEVEKSLVVGGMLISLGVGGLFGVLFDSTLGFWCGVICAGVLLFGVALLVLVLALKAPTSYRPAGAVPLEGGTHGDPDGFAFSCFRDRGAA